MNPTTEMKKTLLLTIGCSGAGKSTYANRLAERLNRRFGYRVVVLEADDYFYKDGKYNWNQNQLHAAHLNCQNRTNQQMRAGVDLVICSNTNTSHKDRKPYLELAKKWDYDVRLKYIGSTDPNDLNTYTQRNIHNVPAETIQKQAERIRNGRR
jgi:predicted kinase